MRLLSVAFLLLTGVPSARLTAATPSATPPAPTTAHPARIPVIFDTDIGTDLDDTWALAQLLRSPELDVKLVLTATGDTKYRALIAAKFLAAAGRSDIPVGIGVPATQRASDYNQEPWVRDYQLKDYPGEIVEDGVGRLIHIVDASPGPVTIIAVAPTPNLAAALQRDPQLAGRCRLVAMSGSFAVGYDGATHPAAETNVRAAVGPARATFAAPWLDILMTPLDTCGSVVLGGELYHRVWSATSDPTLRSVIENYCIFSQRVKWLKCDYFATRSTVLFDCVAVYLAYNESLVKTENVSFRITEDGHTVVDPAGPYHARVALHWKDEPAFVEHLAARLLNQKSPFAAP